MMFIDTIIIYINLILMNFSNYLVKNYQGFYNKLLYHQNQINLNSNNSQKEFEEILRENQSYQLIHTFYNMELKDNNQLLQEMLDLIYDLPEKYKDPIINKMSKNLKNTFENRYQEYLNKQNKNKIKDYLIKIFIFCYIIYLI
jgi:hypothetical protein